MNIPKSWSEVTISTFYKYHAAVKMKLPDSPPLQTEINILSALTGEDFKALEALKVTEIKELVSQIGFIGTLPSKRLPLEFELDGKRWKANIFQTDMTGGQFIDYSAISEQIKKDKEDIIYSMHEFLACFCIPQDENGEFIYKGYTKTSQIIEEKMTVDMAYPFFLFFSNVWKKLYPRILDYSRERTTKNLNYLKKQMKKMAS